MLEKITQQLHQELHHTFHFTHFRPGQLEALTELMQSGRLLCIQPTGHGKSLLYQLPSVLLDGITLVISPLLALMRDQQAQLKNRFHIAAASINTDQSEEENRTAKQAAINQSIRILFIAPEQLDSLDRLNFLLNLPIRLLVIDEAHCISTWGHDFRPSYRQIVKLVEVLMKKNPDLKLLGLTATANEKTEQDIKKQLTVSNKEIIIHRESMDRPNIRLTVLQTSGIATKLATMLDLLKKLEGTGLIYCATRENTELVAEYLSGQGISIAPYHAGIEIQIKRLLQQDFINDKYQVIAATNALGMGIDKSNLRYIIHFDFPGSITAYYQEVGRCGRDGLPADGILLYDPADSKIQTYFIESAQPTRSDFEVVLNGIAHAEYPLNLAALKRLTGMHPTRLTVILAELIEQAFIQKVSRNGTQIYQLTMKPGNPNLIRYTNQLKARTHELMSMQLYAEKMQHCLMATLRSALGDKNIQDCGQCNRCQKHSPFKEADEKDLIVSIQSWLNRKTVVISLANQIKNSSIGVAVLDAKLRSKNFVNFMRQRATSHVLQIGISDDLMELIQHCLMDLTKHYHFSCIIPLPSRTWSARDAVSSLLANFLKIPVFFDALSWQFMPDARQGELLNNDQRKHNVHQRMQVAFNKKLPKGTILLFDDYIGSGATLNEAGRVIRAQVENQIFPFTIAAVKWRLGKKGMV